MQDKKETLASVSIDEMLLARLPIPLPQLYRRACNAKTPFERHLTAFYLWEAALKLLSSVAIVEYASLADRDAGVVERLQNLACPSTGHWWEFARTLAPILAGAQRKSFAGQANVLLGKGRRDLPQALALHAALGEALGEQGGNRQTVRVSDVFERLVRYRNREIGHGAAGRRTDAFYDALGRTMLAGVSEIMAELDVLAGQRLIYVSSVRRQESGTWLVQRYELIGAAPRRIESQELPETPAGRMPLPERVYLLPAESPPAPGGTAERSLLHPLVVYDPTAADVAFLNARRDAREVEYLSYTSGRVHRETLPDDHRELMTRVLGISVGDQQLARWSEQSLAEQPAEASMPAQPAAAVRTLGEFELLSQIGRGGMGVVYRAWQPSLGRHVAVKSLVRTGDAQSEARFGREIRALGRVDHPHVIKVFTSGVDQDQWFYAMELIEGADLSRIRDELAGVDASTLAENQWHRAITTALEKVQSGTETASGQASAETVPTAEPRTPVRPPRTAEPGRPDVLAGRGHVPEVVEIIRQVAIAVHTLHESGIVHRDIKPGNIMIMLSRDTCHAVLMDLGIAQIADEVEGRLTRTRQFVGTLRYASPEQLISAGTVDRRADIYSLGATLWELLTLKPLYDATEAMSTPELMRRIQSQEPDRPRKHNPRIPRDLEAIALKCLERDRDRRYQTAVELADDLARWQRGEPVHAQPHTVGYIVGKYVRRHKLRFAAAAAVALLAAAGTIAAFVMVNEAKNEAIKAKNEAIIARAEAEDLQEQAERREAESWFEQSYTMCVEKGPVKGILSLAHSLQVADRAKHEELVRGIHLQIAGWNRPLHRQQAMASIGSSVSAIAFSADGSILASGSIGNQVQLWNARDGTPVGSTMDCGAAVTALAFSPKSESLVTATQTGVLRMWNVHTCKPLGDRFGVERAGKINDVAVSPDGRFILAGYENHSARLYDSAGVSVGNPWNHDEPVSAVAFARDGKLAITGDRQGGVQVRRTQTREPAAKDLWVAGGVLTLRPVSDGATVLIGSGVGRLTKESLPTVTDNENVKPPSASAAAGFRFLDPPWQFISVGRRQLVSAPPNSSALGFPSSVAFQERAAPAVKRELEATAMAISPAGTTFAVGQDDGSAVLWSPGQRSGERKRVGEPLQHTDVVTAVEYHPKNDRILATGCADGTVRVWEVQPEGLVLNELEFGDMIYTLALGPDDRTLAVAGNGGEVRLWNLESGKAVGKPLPHAGTVHALAFSPDGQLLLTGGCEDGVAYLWNTTTGTRDGAPLPHDNTVNAAAFRPDGSIIATACDDRKARLWDVRTRKLVLPPLPHDDEVLSVEFSPDGKTLLTSGKDRRARLWSVATGEVLTEPVNHPGEIYCSAFSPDGKTIVVGGQNSAQLWDIQARPPVAVGEPMLHEYDVRDAAFSRDGRYLVTVALDARTRIWDPHTARAVGPALQHDDDELSSVVLTRDGRFLVTGSGTGVVLVRRAVPSLSGTPEQIRVWTELITGQELAPRGSLRPLDAGAWRDRAVRLKELGGTPLRGTSIQ